MPSLVPGTKRLLDEGLNVPGYGNVMGQTFESNVPYVLRFMIDKGIHGADWVTLPAGKYSLATENTPFQATHTHTHDSNSRISRCTLEADISFDSLVSHECTGVYNSLSPLRILSFDIECQGRKGHFPDALLDPVIQIACVVSVQGQELTPLVRTVFTLNTCLPIVGAHVDSSQSEADMLLKFRSFVLASDPDLITGYNIGNFDFPYLLTRAKTLGKYNETFVQCCAFGASIC